MEYVDEIYELIQKDNSMETYKNNSEIFLSFYLSMRSITKFDSKLIDIFKYLIQIEDDDDLPYASEASSVFSYFCEGLNFKFYDGYTDIDDKIVEDLYQMIEYYEELKPYDKHNYLIDKNRYIRDYTSSMIIALNKKFFELSADNIKKMFSYIKNNKYIEEIVRNPELSLLDQEYIYEYFNRFLFAEQIVNIDNVLDDIFLKNILDGNVKDIKFLTKVFKNINIDILLSYYQFDLTKFTNALDKMTSNKFSKLDLFNIVYDRIKNKGYYRILLRCCIDKENDLYFSEEENDAIIKNVVSDYQYILSDQEINYLLEHYPYKNDYIFLLNLKINLEKNNWSEETKNKIKNITKDIELPNYSFDDVIHFFDLRFKGEYFGLEKIIAAFTRLARTFIGNENIKIYVIDSDEINGCVIESNSVIKLSIGVLKKFIQCVDFEKEPLDMYIMDTLHHECTHLLQYIKNMDENMSDEDYINYKENVLVNILNGYYHENYYTISYEKEARTLGAHYLAAFLSQYFPHMKVCIDYYKKLEQVESNKKLEDKKMSELSSRVSLNDAIDKIVLVNPSIITKFPMLQREYNLDGTKKEELNKKK